MSKRVLMVTFQYPPFGGSSGLHRALSFSRELPKHGWQPLVLAPHQRAYQTISHDMVQKIPANVPVFKASAFDASRHFAIRGRYLGWMAMPDQWSSWWFSGVWTGLRMIRKYRPAAIWSSYPITTAHLIALTLHRLSGVPWVADFRDPMVYEAWPVEPTMRRVRQWAEKRIITHCTQAVFVTDSARDLYAERYSMVPESRFSVIANGYDEEAFADLDSGVIKTSQMSDGKPMVLLHSGLLEQSDRDPTPFLEALASLRDRGIVKPGEVKVILRDSGSDEIYQPVIDRCRLGELVSLAPRIPYAEALTEMLSVDGLLVFQGSDCNRQIPAKIYEYIRARKPMLAMVDPAGETFRLLQQMGIYTTVRLDDKAAIEERLESYLQLLRSSSAPLPTEDDVRRHSRQWKAEELASLLDTLTD